MFVFFMRLGQRRVYGFPPPRRHSLFGAPELPRRHCTIYGRLYTIAIQNDKTPHFTISTSRHHAIHHQSSGSLPSAGRVGEGGGGLGRG